jgi:hypothetical protein
MKLLGQKDFIKSQELILKFLQKYKEGIIVSSACLSGISSKGN